MPKIPIDRERRAVSLLFITIGCDKQEPTKERGSIMTNKKTEPGVYNEWGKLREVVIGIEDNTVVPDYVPALRWA